MNELSPGVYVLAGPTPLCRPAAAYRLRTAGDHLVTALVDYSPGSPAMVGRLVSWPRQQFDAAWQLGDVRVVPAWSAPTETLREVRERLMEGARVGRRRARAAVLATGGAL